ncbi:MAG: YkgJ family cysteine cluster protein [Anaerolineaceae bacterium]|nr:YkgJ family cysteine cluster protein [Anaerolineaceae bacterium]
MSKHHFDKLEKDLAGGLRFVNLLASTNQEDLKENMVLLYSLVEVLVSKGLIHIQELEKRKKMLIESLEQNDEQRPKVYLLEAPDKYTEGNELTIDCASCHSSCKAACCTLWFALSVQDLDEGIAKWNYLNPYGIAQDEDGYCVHFDRSNYNCTIYENRPFVCRTYDCREDKRIWLDFENKHVNPEIASRLGKK